MALALGADTPVVDARGTSALSWGAPVVVDDQPWAGHKEGTSLAIIDGNPAVSYAIYGRRGQSASFTLYYARANDSAGTSWGRPVTVVAWPTLASSGYKMYTSLCDVNGRPAIAYMDTTDVKARDMCYVRAADSTGKKWGTPVIADGNGDTGLRATMKVVSGNPAIVYKDYRSTSYYVRALDPNGDTWGTPVEPDPSHYGIVIPALEIVNGHPAVCYGVNTDLFYNRATDPNGDNWTTPVKVQNPGFGRPRLAVVDGCPAIAGHSDGGLFFIRALDADGAAWPTDKVVVSDGTELDMIGSLAVIGGLPSIAFARSDTGENPSPLTLNFSQALDATGSAWGTPETLASIGTMDPTYPWPRLAEVGPGAGLAFMDTSHAMNFVGTLPAPPDPAVNVQLSTDKSGYIIGQDTDAVLTAVVTDEYGDPITGLDSSAFVTTLDGGSISPGFSEGSAGTYTGSVSLGGLGAGDHTVLTTVTDARQISGDGSATFSMIEPGSGGTMHVGDLDASADPGPHGWWRATFNLKIDDGSHNPVNGADVAFTLDGVESGSGLVSTGTDGTAVYQTGWIKSSGSVMFTVYDVTHETKTYNSADNHDPDGDFPDGGNSITISGP